MLLWDRRQRVTLRCVAATLKAQEIGGVESFSVFFSLFVPSSVEFVRVTSGIKDG
jgi:hypothetical protein